MSIKLSMFALVLALGCTKAPPNESPAPPTEPGLALKPVPPPAPVANATVTLTAVTLADDCGGTPPTAAPAPAKKMPPAASSVAPSAPMPPGVVAQEPIRRRCDQTSMQLAIEAKADTDVQIKSVEVIDDAGKSVGVLTASKPTQWRDAKYVEWDGKVAAGQSAQVSYVLSQPTLDRTWEYMSHDHTYTVKVLASVGGVDQPLQTTVMIVALPPPVPT